MSAIIKMADINVLRTITHSSSRDSSPAPPRSIGCGKCHLKVIGVASGAGENPLISPHSFVYGCRTFPTSGLCIPPAAGLKLNSSLQTDCQFTSLSCTGKNKPSAGPTPLFPCTSIKADPVFLFVCFLPQLPSWSAVTASPAGLFLPSEWGVKKEKKNDYSNTFLFCLPHSKWHSKSFPMQNKQRFITTAPRKDRRAASLSWSSVLMWAFPCFWKHLRARLTWRFSPSSVWSTLRRQRGGGAQWPAAAELQR